MIGVLIIEDEIPASEYLEYQLRLLDPEVVVLTRLATVRESVAWLSEHRADLIFMDIHLADGNCFRIFEEIEVKAPVIFTTAYDQYAIKAFKVNSIDYLLKPINAPDLRKSLEKFKSSRQIQADDLLDLTDVIRNLSRKPDYQQRFMVYSGERIRAIKTVDIAYFYIIEKEVFLCNFEGRNFGIDYSLDKLENSVDTEAFFRINRKMIINLEAIENMYQLSGSRIRVILKPACPEEAIVSFHRIQAFKKWLNR
jgi:DNA-binding LytR/AlgR family response regulator